MSLNDSMMEEFDVENFHKTKSKSKTKTGPSSGFNDDSESLNKVSGSLNRARKLKLPSSGLLRSNLWLIVVLITFCIFNFLKHKVFDGYVISLMELFYTCSMLFIGFYFSSLAICNKTCHLSLSSIQSSLMVFLVVGFISTFNPCKNYLKLSQLMTFNCLVIAAAYNTMLVLIRNNKEIYCSKSGNIKHIAVLLAIHLAKIYLYK